MSQLGWADIGKSQNKWNKEKSFLDSRVWQETKGNQQLNSMMAVAWFWEEEGHSQGKTRRTRHSYLTVEEKPIKKGKRKSIFISKFKEIITGIGIPLHAWDPNEKFCAYHH